MSCACDCYYDGNGPSVFSRYDRVARKEHRCCECHRVIPRGAKYTEETGLWDDHWSRYRTCELCVNVRDTEFSGGCYAYELLWEKLKECYRDRDDDDTWLDPPTHPITVGGNAR